ncbi:hypothetical protein [Kineococcus rubinsiae]|uniref:hypothetical protein n=1 Tax=Kineococcus rubinsiae TaxID=2609562 RepID=UPI0014310CFC|nr:hypothetical protein [Kineococcus rubinsiae]NIZ93300.1 hypothetical protein [Kineococcus rubinsiae]
MTEQRAVDAWWRGLDSARRELALSVAAGETLSADLAASLRAAGVDVPEVVVGWDVDGTFERRTLHVQPHAVADYLDEVRAAAAATGPLPVVLELAS